MNLKTKIKGIGITQKQFSSMCGVNLRTVQRWVREDKIPRWSIASSLLDNPVLSNILSSINYGNSFNNVTEITQKEQNY